MRPRRSLLPIVVVALAAAAAIACGGGGDDEAAPAGRSDDAGSSGDDAAAAPEPDAAATPDDAAPPDDASARRTADAGDGGAYALPRARDVVTVEQASARVMAFDFDVADWSQPNAVVWTWSPPSPTTTFSNLSDVKYSKDGLRFFVAASGGGIAVVRLSDKKVLMQATPGGNVHGVEELPGGNVVSASSTGGYLKLFSSAGALLQTVPLTDAHGVYWDGARQRLYADGATVVRSFTYTGGLLHASTTYTLPAGDSGAHDLFPLPFGNGLYVSDGAHVLELDRATGVFAPYASGPQRSGIKAVGHNPGASVVCLLKATNAPGPQPRSWSSDTVIFDQPGATPATVTRVRPGAQFYKARWAAPTP